MTLSQSEKLVFIEPLWKLRTEYQYLIQYPPEGYRFLVKETALERVSRSLSRFGLAYRTLFTLARILPVHLMKPYWEQLKRIPPGVVITYAVLHPVFRREAWLLAMHGEQPHLLAGGEQVFMRQRRRLRKLLASQYCKRIICDVEAGKRAMIRALGAPALEEKIVVIPPAVPAVPATNAGERRKLDMVRILFVGSANIDAAWQFRDKGGYVLLQAFEILRSRYPNLELVVRSRVPESVGARWRGTRGVRIIDEVLPESELGELFKSSDMLVCPTHLTPSMTFVHAFSYGLPVVTTDVWSNPEIVEDGQTGLLVHHSQAHRYIEDSWVHHDSPEFHQVVNSVDRELVEQVVQSVTLLIEDPELRARLAANALQRTTEGRFSLHHRRQLLKRLLDDATYEGAGPLSE
jgi:glycosyltransferase involved in cell wall biosynthesis